MRAANLLRALAERHEVRQLSQARLSGRGDPEGARGPFTVTPSYAELRMAAPVATIATELGARTWIRAPILSGAGLARSPRLRALARWADVVLVEFPWQFAACRRARPDVPIVLAGCNVEAAKFADYAAACGSPRTAPVWMRTIERLERRAVQDADLVLAVSDADRDELIRRYAVPAARVVTIPNGADTTAYGAASPEARRAARVKLGLPDRPTVLFAGSDVPPNQAGLAWVRKVAARAPHLTFLVTGAVAPPSRDGIVATGLLDDFGVALAAADFALCPIEFGGGTKIKLLEGLAAGLPTVAFAEALHGLDLDGEVLVAPKTEHGLLRALDRLSDPAVARDLARRGRDAVAARYDWRALGRTLEAHLEDLVARRGPAQATVGSGSGSGSVREPTTS